ncbi:MAG: hypothetical protein FWD17_05500 [Polyangiaceae bacterium]|nr:hypothetical protein [Polyangiaceae bacterium]
MNHVSVGSQTIHRAKSFAERVRDRARALGCHDVWVKESGPHAILGRDGGEAFARVTPLGPGAFGLAFRRADFDGATDASPWDAVLLIDALGDVVEHALIGEGALRPFAP